MFKLVFWEITFSFYHLYVFPARETLANFGNKIPITRSWSFVFGILAKSVQRSLYINCTVYIGPRETPRLYLLVVMNDLHTFCALNSGLEPGYIVYIFLLQIKLQKVHLCFMSNRRTEMDRFNCCYETV